MIIPGLQTQNFLTGERKQLFEPLFNFSGVATTALFDQSDTLDSRFDSIRAKRNHDPGHDSKKKPPPDGERLRVLNFF